MYPTDIPAFRAAALRFDPPEAMRDAFYAVQGEGSPVALAVGVFDLLKASPVEGDGLKLLLGAAHLIAAQGWNGLGAEAATVLATRSRDLVG